MFTGGFETASSSRRTGSSCPGCRPGDPLRSGGRARVVSGMRPTGRLHLGHLVGALGNWVPLQAHYDCFYFVADWHALTSDYADTSQLTAYAYDNVGRLDRRRTRSREEHVLHPVARARARRAVPAAVDGRAGAVARTRADLQGAAGEPEGQGSVVDRVSRLPAAADRRRRHVRRAVRAGRRRSGRRTSSWRARSCAASTTSSASVLVEPQPLLTTFARLPGLDGDKKMSKSLGNTIHLSDSADDVKKSDADVHRSEARARRHPRHGRGNPVFTYHDAFNPEPRRGRGSEGRATAPAKSATSR